MYRRLVIRLGHRFLRANYMYVHCRAGHRPKRIECRFSGAETLSKKKKKKNENVLFAKVDASAQPKKQDSPQKICNSLIPSSACSFTFANLLRSSLTVTRDRRGIFDDVGTSEAFGK